MSSPTFPMRFVSLLIFSCFSHALWAMGQGPAPVIVDTLTQIELQNRTEVSGRVESLRHVMLGPQVAGRVLKTTVNDGALVAKGQVLLQLDPEPIRMDLKVAKGELDALEAQLFRTNNRLTLQKAELQDQLKAEQDLPGSISRSELRQAEQSVTDLKAQVLEIQSLKAAQSAAMDKLQLQLSYHELKAPFSGQVLKRTAAAGDWLNPGQVAFEIIAPQELQIVLEVPSSLLGMDPKALEAWDIHLDGLGETIKAGQWTLSRSVDLRSKTFRLIGRPLGKAHNLVPGMSLRAQLPQGPAVKHLTVDNNAVLKNASGAFVYKVVPGQQGEMVVPVPIAVLFRDTQRSAVRSAGLAAGDRVVKEGGERLFPMTPVAPK